MKGNAHRLAEWLEIVADEMRPTTDASILQEAAALIRSQDVDIERLRSNGIALALRVLQSDLVLDEKEMSARDAFIADHSKALLLEGLIKIHSEALERELQERPE